MITPNPFLGTLIIAIGAIAGAVCFTPQKKVVHWSFQTYWLTQAAFSCFLLPILCAMATIPDLWTVLSLSPKVAMINSFMLGAIYGVGGIAFGVALRYIGFSLTYAIAIGLSSVLGTMLDPFMKHRFGGFVQDLVWHGELTTPFDWAELSKIFHTASSFWHLWGMAVGIVGIAIFGYAGRMKENQLQGTSSEFRLGKGLFLAILAGVISAVYAFALSAAQPIVDIVVKHNAEISQQGADLWQDNVRYIFSNSGAFLTAIAYCGYLHFKQGTAGEWVRLPSGSKKGTLAMNFAMAALTGMLWYGQFFIFTLGNVRMGEYKHTSWAILMTLLVLTSTAISIVFGEWKGCRRSTYITVTLAMAILLASVMLISYGNYIGILPMATKLRF